MRRTTLNLLATATILAGGAHLAGSPLSAATSTVGGGSSTAPTVWCSGGTPADPCICTSGDGKAVCKGATCTANETSCTYTGFPKADTASPTPIGTPDGNESDAIG